MESVMKAVLLTRTVVKLGFFIDISFDLKNIVNHDQATLYHHIQFELHEQQVHFVLQKNKIN